MRFNGPTKNDNHVADPNEMIDLGDLGGEASAAYGINHAGDTVGFSFFSEFQTHAFFYSGGLMTDLNSLIDPNNGWELEEAWAISDAGHIVGLGSLNGFSNKTFLLTPIGSQPDSADFDTNGFVDGKDFLIWQQHFPTLGAATHAIGDANHDGNVLTNDLGIWELQYGLTAPYASNLSRVPESASMTLFVMGVLGNSRMVSLSEGPLVLDPVIRGKKWGRKLDALVRRHAVSLTLHRRW